MKRNLNFPELLATWSYELTYKSDTIVSCMIKPMTYIKVPPADIVNDAVYLNNFFRARFPNAVSHAIRGDTLPDLSGYPSIVTAGNCWGKIEPIDDDFRVILKLLL